DFKRSLTLGDGIDLFSIPDQVKTFIPFFNQYGTRCAIGALRQGELTYKLFHLVQGITDGDSSSCLKIVQRTGVQPVQMHGSQSLVQREVTTLVLEDVKLFVTLFD